MKSINTNKPYVVVYGDDDQRTVTKGIWAVLSGYGLELAAVDDMTELENLASGAVLILYVTQGVNDKNNRRVLKITHSERVVADIVAITEPISDDERLQILSVGFDAVFNFDFMEKMPFKQVLMDRIDKGFIRLENRIQQEEYRRFKAALAASPDAFIVFDNNNKLFFVSEHYLNAYPKNGKKLVRGVDVMDAYEMCSAEQGVKKGDERYDAMRVFWEKMEGEAEFTMNDGRIWYIKAKKLPDNQGTIVTTSDITRHRSQQIELEEKSVELETLLVKEQEASRIQKQFINMVSHEFRTPLSIIDGNAQIIQRRAKNMTEDDLIKKTKTIRSAVSRLVNMMEGVLSSNMLNTGRLQLDPYPVEIKSLISELCEEYEVLSGEHEIKATLENLPDNPVLDQKFLTLIVSNLLSNAVKFGGKNPLIEVKGWKEAEALFLEVSDSGIGIAENEIDHIFERYYRTATSNGIPGTGIGLHLARDLVKLHGGEISVKSELGKGARFTVSLPYTEQV